MQEADEDESLKEETISREEVMEAMSSLRNNKAGGPDQIPVEMIKKGGNTLIDKVVKIVQNVFETGQINQDFVRSEIITLPKKNNTMKCEEHCTIALTSHSMKILLKVIANRIKPVLNKNIDPLQYGFMPNRGTIEAVTALKTTCSNKIDIGQALFVAFVDFEKLSIECITGNCLKSWRIKELAVNVSESSGISMQHRQHTQDKIPQPSSQSQEVCVKDVFCPQLCIISIQKKLLKVLERIKGQKLEDKQSTE